ncbi:MAG: hypothetical protein QXM31_00890 [Candidatus Woesearchaeota archaeon]
MIDNIKDLFEKYRKDRSESDRIESMFNPLPPDSARACEKLTLEGLMEMHAYYSNMDMIAEKMENNFSEYHEILEKQKESAKEDEKRQLDSLINENILEIGKQCIYRKQLAHYLGMIRKAYAKAHLHGIAPAAPYEQLKRDFDKIIYGKDAGSKELPV